MKTNCPHCQGEIVIPVNCCNGDDAIQGVFTPAQYEKMQNEAEEQKLAKKAKKELFEKELEDFIAINATAYQRFWLKLSLFSVYFLLAFVLCFFLAFFFLFLYTNQLSFFYGNTMTFYLAVLFICLMIFNLLLFYVIEAVKERAEKINKKNFLKLHPEYPEFNV